MVGLSSGPPCHNPIGDPKRDGSIRSLLVTDYKWFRKRWSHVWTTLICWFRNGWSLKWTTLSKSKLTIQKAMVPWDASSAQLTNDFAEPELMIAEPVLKDRWRNSHGIVCGNLLNRLIVLPQIGPSTEIGCDIMKWNTTRLIANLNMFSH